MQEKPNYGPITITTLVIGADYTESLQMCLQTKHDYAAKHGYKFIQGTETFWDRTKPIAWSKIPFLLNVMAKLPEGAIIWQSDADVLITNQDLRLEDHVIPLLPEDKDMLMTLDACGHINSGNILFRNTAWARDFWKRVGSLTQFTYHPWWENAAMLALYTDVPEDFMKISVTRQHKVFNAYLRGLSDEPLWAPGDFLVHFAGVYDLKQMAQYAVRCQAGEAFSFPLLPQEVEHCAQSRADRLALIGRSVEA